jgi:hypothetical protein
VTKAELLEALAKGTGDEEHDHCAAEDALLAFVNDPEITAAWNKACAEQNWWYA